MGCATRDELLRFLTDRLSDAECESIVDHVEQCARCSRELEGLCAAEDLQRFRADYRHAAERGKTPGLRAVMARADQLWIWAAVPRANDDSDPPGEEAAGLDGVEPAPEQVGQYDIVGPLGQGGMGAVYEARHRRLKRRVAIKLIAAHRLGDRGAIQRFHREMEAIGRLQHANVVQAFDAGECEGTHYLAMELVDGCDVEKVACACGPLGLADACEIVRQAALGLAHAHQHGLVHRDIKPSNLLLAVDGTVKVADLGLARFRESESSDLTGSNRILGTVDYVSPEQARGDRTVDARSDLYSLGCVLYRLLVGRPPFSRPRYGSTLKKLVGHAQDDPPTLADARPEAPAELCGLLAALLAKDPADRPESAASVAEILQPLAAGSVLKLRDIALRAQHAPREAGADVTAGATSPGQTTLPEQEDRERRSPVFVPRKPGQSPARRRWLVAATAAIAGLAALTSVIFPRLRGNLPESRVSEDSDRPQDAEGAEDPVSPERGSGIGKWETSSIPGAARSARGSRDRTWQNLLACPPVVLQWLDGPGTVAPRYDGSTQEVVALALEVGLLQLGEVASGSYTMQLGVRQPKWESGVGAFFGFHSVATADGEERRCQVVSLAHGLRPEEYRLDRSVVTIRPFRPDRGQRRQVFVGQTIPVPAPHEHILELTVERGRLVRATWAGIDLETLVDRRWEPSLAAADHYGGLGIYLNVSTGVFSNARLMIYEK